MVMAFMVILFGALAGRAQTALNVTGVADKGSYNNTVTFSVATEAGYTYATYLNGDKVSSGGSYTINASDFYLLQVFRTNTTTSVITNRLFRIVVNDTSHGTTEFGLPSHTPLLAIPSASNGFAGGRLLLIAPANFPIGYEIPVVA